MCLKYLTRRLSGYLQAYFLTALLPSGNNRVWWIAFPVSPQYPSCIWSTPPSVYPNCQRMCYHLALRVAILLYIRIRYDTPLDISNAIQRGDGTNFWHPVGIFEENWYLGTLKLLPKACRHPVGGSKDVVLNGVPASFWQQFHFSLLVFQSVTTDCHHDWPWEDISVLLLVNYNATNYDINTRL